MGFVLGCERHTGGRGDPQTDKSHRDEVCVIEWMAVHVSVTDSYLLTYEAHMLLQNPVSWKPGSEEHADFYVVRA